ncbi:hypothetical protein WJ66_03578, partial [Stenotrophomonas maltophilia WJ66]
MILIFLIFPVVVVARKELSGAGWVGGAGVSAAWM